MLDRKKIQALITSLTQFTWNTVDPPDNVDPALAVLARKVREEIIDEHDHCLYDPHMWARQGIGWVIKLCEKLEERDNLAAARHQVDDPENFRPSCYLVPSLSMPLRRPADCTEDRITDLRKLVEDTCLKMTALVDDMYRRARVEITLYEEYPAQRLCVYDDRTVPEILDDTFNQISTGALPSELETAYQCIRGFIFAHLPAHYSGDNLAGLSFLPHLYHLIRWMVYANSSNRKLNLVFSVGPSRCRYKPENCTGVCWASSGLCGYHDSEYSAVTDGEDVWDLIYHLNTKYNTL
jgi:hypothetical protein